MNNLPMLDHIEKYTQKLLRDRTAMPESIRLYRLDDVVIASRSDEWLPVFTEVFTGLNVTALLFGTLTLPFADLLVERSAPEEDRIKPRDSETRTFLHDIPFIRKDEWTGRSKEELAKKIIACLKERKAVIIQGLGVVASGGVTVEQAYIGYSTIFHTTFVKYLLDLLTEGFRLPGEREMFREFREKWLRPIDAAGLEFAEGSLGGNAERGEPPHPGPLPQGERGLIYEEICRVGRYTVEKGLVDSFFGNISYFDGKTISISQTASSLDELEGHIDPVPLDYSSTAGLSASSELPAHKAIYLSTDYHAVLHGHPKFSVILSMHCTEEDCDIEDCGKNCRRKRAACGVLIVPGEVGAGGLAKTVPAAIKDAGACIVYGHGVFSAGEKDFQAAFMRMVEVENRCREEYFSLMRNKDR